MQSAIAENLVTEQRPPTLKPALSRFKARRIKKSLIEAYCRQQISAEAVATAFAIFKELRSA